ncbi:MAG: hypothetical protein ABIU11_01450 [Chitinophagaceae bacterium]
MNCLYFLSFIGLLFTFNKTAGQTSSLSNSASYNNVRSYYQNEIAENAYLFTGKEYTKYTSGIQGTPFFNSAEMQNCELFYDGTLYQDVPLLFDLVRQEIVINRYDDNTRIKLLNEKIKYFKIAGHRFDNIILSEGSNEDVSNGFYDIVFEGKASVLVSRVKKVEMTLNPEDPPKFAERDKIFIRNENQFYLVNNINSILNALKDKKDLIRTFIRKNKFRFKKNIEEELGMTAAYYETLIRQI